VAFSERLGHDFADPDLLRRALTHSSLSSPTRPDNQRLEFLGDRVLGLVMAEALLAHDTEAREGQLAPRFNALVRKETCADVAREIDLGAVLRLGKSEMATGGRRKQALLGDAMEAVIAAVYLDAGFDGARDDPAALGHARDGGGRRCARRQDRAAGMGAGPRSAPPAYVEIARTGPDHAPVFTVEARLDTGETARAEGRVKRQAEQAAARDLLERLGAE
jgi:ribonuclease-3